MGNLKKSVKYIVSASFLGLVIGLISIYLQFRGTRTHMSMDVAAESNVLDVKHPIPDLSIFFQGRDIEEEKSNLKILTVRVVNDGESNIHEDDFDSRMPFGLRIDGGRVIRVQVIGANSDYLSENVHPKVEGENQIEIDKVIFDKGKFVSLEILVLHPKSSNPQLIPMGKIAGIEQIAITNSFQDHEQKSFIDQIFSGPAAVQVPRAIVYSVLSLIIIIIVGFAIAGVASIPSKWRKRMRRQIAKLIPELEPLELERKRKIIEKIYVDYGSEGLNFARETVNDETALKRMTRIQHRFQGGSIVSDSRAEELVMQHRMEVEGVPSSIWPLFEGKLVSVSGDELNLDPDVKHLIDEFIKQTQSVIK